MPTFDIDNLDYPYLNYYAINTTTTTNNYYATNTTTTTNNYHLNWDTTDGWVNFRDATIEFGTEVQGFADIFVKFTNPLSQENEENFEPKTEDELRGFIEEALDEKR